MWQHVVWEPDDDPDSETIEFERLAFGDRNIDVYAMPEGGFFVEAVDDCRGELAIGTADTMDEAKGLARQWMMGEIGKLLKAAGAAGVWMANGNQWEVTNINHDPIVYIVRAENGLYKIGYTKSVVSRVHALDNLSPIPVLLFHLITTNNTHQLERQLHEKLFPFWVRGEWFSLPDETANWLVSITDMQYEESRVPYVDEYDSYYRYGTVRRLAC